MRESSFRISCAGTYSGQHATAAACNQHLYVQITDPAATLSSVGIANGDSLTVRQAAAPAEPPAATPAASGAAAGLGLEAVEAAAAAAGGDGYAMVRR